MYVETEMKKFLTFFPKSVFIYFSVTAAAAAGRDKILFAPKKEFSLYSSQLM